MAETLLMRISLSNEISPGSHLVMSGAREEGNWNGLDDVMESIREYDSAPFFLELPLMRNGSETRANGRTGDVEINERMIAMLEREIVEKRVPAYVTHGWLWNSPLAPAGHWVGTERRGDTLYGALYLGKSTAGAEAREMIAMRRAVGGKMGNSVVVFSEKHDEKGKPIWWEGNLISIDLVPSEGAAVVADSEAMPKLIHMNLLDLGRDSGRKGAEMSGEAAVAKVAAGAHKAPADEMEARVAELEKQLASSQAKVLSYEMNARVDAELANDPPVLQALLRDVLAEVQLNSVDTAVQLLARLRNGEGYCALAKLVQEVDDDKPAADFGPSIGKVVLSRDYTEFIKPGPENAKAPNEESPQARLTRMKGMADYQEKIGMPEVAKATRLKVKEMREGERGIA